MQRDEYYGFEFATERRMKTKTQHVKKIMLILRFKDIPYQLSWIISAWRENLPDAMMHRRRDNRMHSRATVPMAAVALFVQP